MLKTIISPWILLGIVCATFNVYTAESIDKETSQEQAQEQSQERAQELPRWRDWPNWRGPTCSGSAIDYSGGLDTDAKLLWTSEEQTYPGLMKGIDPPEGFFGYPIWGFSSFAIVDRRLYFYHARPHGESTEISRNILKRFAKNYFKWRKMDWVKNNEEPDREKLDVYAKLYGTDVFMGLDAVTGRTLWKAELEGRGLNFRHVRPVPYYPHNVPCWADNKVFGHGTSFRVHAIDGITGEPLWESDLGGRAWFINNQYIDVCLHHRASDRTGRHGSDFAGVSSMIVADRALIGRCHDGPKKGRPNAIVAFDIDTGRRLWWRRNGLMTVKASPLRWTAPNGKDYVIIYGKDSDEVNYDSNDCLAVCLDPMTGKEIWQAKPFPRLGGTIAVSDKWMVATPTHKVRGSEDRDIASVFIYKITPEKAELVHKVPGFGNDGYSPTIHGDHALFIGRWIDLNTGEVTKIASGFAAGGTYAKTISNGMLIDNTVAQLPDGKGVRLKIDGQQEFSYGEMNMVEGRQYIRGRHRWWAYDLRADKTAQDRYSTPVAPEHAVSIDSKHEQVKALGSPHFTERMTAIEKFPIEEIEMAEDLVKIVINAPYPNAKAASKVLVRMGAKAKAFAPALAAALPATAESGSYGRITLLTNAVTALDPDAFVAQVPALASLLAKENDLTRFRSCKALEQIGAGAASASPALIELLKKKDTYLFRNAALALAAIGPAAGQEATNELSRHLDSQEHDLIEGETLVHALIALQTVGGQLSDETIEKLMSFAFVADKFEIKQCLPFEPFTDSPLLSRVHHVSYLAAKCLAARPEQCLEKVITHLEGTVTTPKTEGSQPTLMHYLILSISGEPALRAVPLLEARKDVFDFNGPLLKVEGPKAIKTLIARVKSSGEAAQ